MSIWATPARYTWGAVPAVADSAGKRPRLTQAPRRRGRVVAVSRIAGTSEEWPHEKPAPSYRVLAPGKGKAVGPSPPALFPARVPVSAETGWRRPPGAIKLLRAADPREGEDDADRETGS